jgi:hypothetical protein
MVHLVEGGSLTNGSYMSGSPFTVSDVTVAKDVVSDGIGTQRAAGKKWLMNCETGMPPKKCPFVSIASRLLRLPRRCVPESYVTQPDDLKDMCVCVGIRLEGLEGVDVGVGVFGIASRFA